MTAIPTIRELHHFTARHLDELTAVTGPLGLTPYGFGDPDEFVLAARILRQDPPAMLQLTRNPGATADTFIFKVVSLGEEVDTADLDAEIAEVLDATAALRSAAL